MPETSDKSSAGGGGREAKVNKHFPFVSFPSMPMPMCVR
jgi:hypothetical protein